MKRAIITLAGAGLVLTACGPQPTPRADKPVWARGALIEAQGRAFLEVPPNRARFDVAFEHKAAASDAAAEKAIEKANIAAEAIRTAAEGAVRIRADISVRPYYEQVTIKVGEFEEELVENVYPDALKGYVATVDVQVTVLDPAKAEIARGAALAAKPTSGGEINFFLEPTAADQRAAFEAAAKDAEARAQLAAAASGAKLGALEVLQEGYGPCLGSPSSDTGYDEYARYAPAAAPPPPPAPSRAMDRLEKVVVTGQAIAEEAGAYALAADPDPVRVEARVCAIYARR